MSNSKILLALLILSLAACTTIPPDEREAIREQVNQVAAETLATLKATDPQVEKELETAVGYFVGRLSNTKLPIVGGGYGLGVLHDLEKGTRTYINITRFEVGAGLGAGRVRGLLIFQDREEMEKVRNSAWQSALGAEASTGDARDDAVAMLGRSFTTRYLNEAGASVSVTARLVNTSINTDLTDTGISDVSIPNTGFGSLGQQGEDAPRVWDHKLPLLAQNVIDKGYDLPLPYGIGLTYSDVDQEQLLSSMSVGINGNPIRPIDFVDFENASSRSQNLSVKADAWVFPFLNVFGMVGRVDGNAPVDVVVDGNGFLDELGTDCGSFPPSPLCPLLEDQLITLPINANFEGTTYGIGMTLAGGWNNWFVAIPMNWTVADMKSSNADGANFTVTPRGGYVFNLGRKGSLALYAGANYLNSDLTVDGIARTPGDELVFDYIIDQKNKDEWNALAGFNWDINKRLSWSAEYNGFVGSRDAFISSLVWKY